MLRYLTEVCGRYRELRPLVQLLERLGGVQTAVGYTF